MTIAQQEKLKILVRKIRHEAVMFHVPPGEKLIPWLESQLEEFGEFFGTIMDAESAKTAASLVRTFDAMKCERHTLNDCRRWMDLASELLRVLVSVEVEKAKVVHERLHGVRQDAGSNGTAGDQ